MREPAWRVFAGEYNDSTHVIKGGGEKTPSYVVTPLGAKINRLFVVGVLTDVENVSHEGEMWRAHVSDPTGIHTIYAGQYQSGPSSFLSGAETPSYVAIVGKSRVYETEEGAVFVSIRPEMIKEVDSSSRDYWIVETCRHTYSRMDAMKEAMSMNPPSAYKLKELGYPPLMAEGVVEALSAYENVDVEHYMFLIREALSHFETGKIEYMKEVDEAEKKILEIVKKCEGEEGALWDEIVDSGEKEGMERNLVEEALASLMDKGMVYEPILGKLKTT